MALLGSVCAARSLVAGAPIGGDGEGLARSTSPILSDRWSFSLESIYAFDNVKNPWFALALHAHKKNRRAYTFATQILSARYRLTDTGGPFLLRGNLEFSLGLNGTAIIHAPETVYGGIVGGFRYNFIQPNAKLIPYLELRGGIGGSDSQHLDRSIQTQATLTYLIGGGLRYQLNSRWSFSVGAVDEHLSTAFFANNDTGIDSFGIGAGIEMRY